MNINKYPMNHLVAIVASSIGLYSLVLMVLDISAVYLNLQAVFEHESALYPLSITVAIALAPLSFFCIAAFVYINKRSYIIIPLAIYGYIFFISYSVYVMFALLLYWWLKKNDTENI